MCGWAPSGDSRRKRTCALSCPIASTVSFRSQGVAMAGRSGEGAPETSPQAAPCSEVIHRRRTTGLRACRGDVFGAGMSERPERTTAGAPPSIDTVYPHLIKISAPRWCRRGGEGMEPPSRRRSGGTRAGTARTAHRTTLAVAWCALVIATAGVIAGCSSGSGSPSLAGPSGSTSPSLAASQPTPTTPSDAKTQVLSQYSAFWAELAPASKAAASRRRALLSPYATDPELSSLLHGMSRGDNQGTVFYGADRPRPHVARLSVQQGIAVINDCQDSSHAGNADSSTGRRLTVGVARHPVTATMHLVQGTWRVAFVSYQDAH